MMTEIHLPFQSAKRLTVAGFILGESAADEMKMSRQQGVVNHSRKFAECSRGVVSRNAFCFGRC